MFHSRCRTYKNKGYKREVSLVAPPAKKRKCSPFVGLAMSAFICNACYGAPDCDASLGPNKSLSDKILACQKHIEYIAQYSPGSQVDVMYSATSLAALHIKAGELHKAEQLLASILASYKDITFNQRSQSRVGVTTHSTGTPASISGSQGIRSRQAGVGQSQRAANNVTELYHKNQLNKDVKNEVNSDKKDYGVFTAITNPQFFFTNPKTEIGMLLVFFSAAAVLLRVRRWSSLLHPGWTSVVVRARVLSLIRAMNKEGAPTTQESRQVVKEAEANLRSENNTDNQPVKRKGVVNASSIQYRQQLVKLMHLASQTWEEQTQKGKLELAEKSKVWRVCVDSGRLRTRAMDRYFSINTLPKKPRWHSVVRTCNFVLRYCNDKSLYRDELEKSLLEFHNTIKIKATTIQEN